MYRLRYRFFRYMIRFRYRLRFRYRFMYRLRYRFRYRFRYKLRLGICLGMGLGIGLGTYRCRYRFGLRFRYRFRYMFRYRFRYWSLSTCTPVLKHIATLVHLYSSHTYISAGILLLHTYYWTVVHLICPFTLGNRYLRGRSESCCKPSRPKAGCRDLYQAEGHMCWTSFYLSGI